MKKHILKVIALALALGTANPAAAECYADYKAKRDNPLRLHYGIIELPDDLCNAPSKAKTDIATRIRVDDWKLLNVMSVFDKDGLKERQESAGEYFLRY